MPSELWYIIAVLILLFGIGFVVVGSPANNAAMQADVAPRNLWSCPDCGAENPLAIRACGCGYRPNDGPKVALSSTHTGWRILGLAILASGIIGLAISLFMSTSVPTFGLDGDQSELINLSLLFNKGVSVACSLAAIGLGAFCVAVSAILEAIQSGRNSN